MEQFLSHWSFWRRIFQVDGPHNLKSFLSMAGPDVISVGGGPDAQTVLKRMEREATHRYQTLTLPEDGAGNGIFINGSLIHRGKEEAPKSDAVRRSTFMLCSEHFSTFSSSPRLRFSQPRLIIR